MDDTIPLLKEVPIDEDEDEFDWVEWIPFSICLAIFLAIIIYICCDYHQAMKVFEQIIDYTKEHPYEAISILILAYVILIIFILPITQLHILVAFAYCKVFNSFWYGFLFATWVIFVGCMIGAFCAILLGRYLFADYIRGKIKKSKNVQMKKFRIVDGMFVTNGIFLVALLRLVFLPFGLTCYFLAVTSIAILDYMIGTIFYLFKIMLIVLIGCSIYEASESN